MKIIKISQVEKAVGFSIPPKIAKNFKIVGDMGNVENWKAKIILANSASDKQKKGMWDDVGYIMISLSSNLIIPIARADEHQTGWDLLSHYIDNNMVPDEQYISVWAVGGNYIYPRDSQKQLQALIKFRQYGGKNNVVEGSYDNRAYRSTIDDFIQDKGSTLVNKAQLSPLGKFIIAQLETIINGWNTKDNRVFSTSYNFLKWIEINSVAMSKAFDFSSDEIEKLKGWLLKAEADQNFDIIADIFFRLNGIKNKMHNKIRQIHNSEWEREELTYIWGNLEVANQEFNRLANL